MPWIERANCRLPEHAGVNFFPSRGESLRPAKTVCADCPVRQECLDYSLSQEYPMYGVWGGTSERERTRMLRNPPPRPINCGTSGGYQAHLRRGEPSCSACRRAHALYQRYWIETQLQQ